MAVIGVFISHSWAYTEHYEKLSAWLFEKSWRSGDEDLIFVDLSIPKTDPIHYAQNTHALEQAILEKIAAAHVLVCPTGMYSEYSTWISRELSGAATMGKKVLAVNPWGQQRKSVVVQSHADRIVGWSEKSVVGSVVALHRDWLHGR